MRRSKIFGKKEQNYYYFSSTPAIVSYVGTGTCTETFKQLLILCLIFLSQNSCALPPQNAPPLTFALTFKSQ
jgi:hypothetical protein